MYKQVKYSQGKITYLNEYKGFRVGDMITITSKPMNWNSLLNDNFPLDHVNFPYTMR